MDFKRVLKRILEKRKNDLINYWKYGISLSEKLIIKILLEENGLSDVERDLFDLNCDYRENTINKILEEELSEKEKENEELQEFLKVELNGYWDLNIKDLIKNSPVKLRITLLDGGDGIYIPKLKKTKTYEFLKKRFKGYLKVKDLENELNSMVESDYGNLVFFGEVKGLRILELREELKQGKITLNENLSCGVFNSRVYRGGDLGLKLKKPITLNLSDWRYTELEKMIKNIENREKSHYSVKIELNNEPYGIQKNYNLTSECWREI